MSELESEMRLETMSIMEIGAWAHQVSGLMGVDTSESWDQASSHMREGIRKLENMKITNGRVLRVFLYVRGDHANEPTTVPAHQREICRMQFEALMDALNEVLDAAPPTGQPFTGPASSSGFGFPVGNPNEWPESGLAPRRIVRRGMIAQRKVPALPLFVPKVKGDKMIFLKSIAHEILQCEEVVEAKRLLATLMVGNDGGFLTSEYFLDATSPESLLGAMLMECEEVDTLAQLKARVFSVKRREGETLLNYIDRANESHRLFRQAFPMEDAQEETLLAHIYDSVLMSEKGLLWVFQGVTSLTALRRSVRALRMDGSGPRMQTSPRTRSTINQVDARGSQEAAGKENTASASGDEMRKTMADMQATINQLSLRDGYRGRNRGNRQQDQGNGRYRQGYERDNNRGGRGRGGGRWSGRGERSGGRDNPPEERPARACFRCGSIHHLVKDCPHPPVGGDDGNPPEGTAIRVAMISPEDDESDFEQDF